MAPRAYAKHLPYIHLLEPLSVLADWCAYYNEASSPSRYRTEEEHQLCATKARVWYQRLRPYILLGVVKEWDSGRLALSERATNPEA